MTTDLIKKHLHVDTYVTARQAKGHTKVSILTAIHELQKIPGTEERVKELRQMMDEIR